MSSTKRGGQRSPADNYPTPAWSVHRFLEEWPPGGRLPPGKWLDPGAGEGNIIYAAQEWFKEQAARDTEAGVFNLHLPNPCTISWDAVELRKECKSDLQRVGAKEILLADYFEHGPPTPEFYQVIMTNPPFSLAMEFITRSLDSSCRYVVMLLRLNYLGSEKRHDFMRKHAPDLYVLPNRPSFKLTGETDSIEYAWFVWDKENLNRGYGSHRMLGLTPVDVRKKEHDRLKGLGLFFEETGGTVPRSKKEKAKKKSEKDTPKPKLGRRVKCAKCGAILGEPGEKAADVDDCPFCYGVKS